MSSGIKKDLSLWIISPSDGRVRKVRISFMRVALVFLLGVGMFGFGAFLASDYLRMQTQGIRSVVALKLIESERNRLLSRAEALEKEILSLKAEKSQALTYQEDVRNRVKKLAALFEGAGSLGLLAQDKDLGAPKGDSPRLAQPEGQKSISAGAKDGIGGAEVDCDPADQAICDEVGAKIRKSGSYSFFPWKRAHPVSEESSPRLLKTLDSYISVLRVAPVGIPTTSTRVSSKYGYRFSPFSLSVKKHEGVDFSAHVGTKVVATGDGIVKSVGWNDTYGLVVDVEHNDRLITRYAHLSKVSVKGGQSVKRGALVGLVGSTGRSTGPHLHYEILLDGRARNPDRYLAFGKKVGDLLE